MNFTKIRLQGLYTIDMPFFGLRPTNKYIVKAVDGLGPPEIDIYLVKKIYSGREPHNRQVIARIGLNPDYSIGETPSALRTQLYGLLTPGPDDALTMKLMNGPNVMVTARGYVSKFEIVPFAKDPEVQITIDCEGPYLEPETDTVLTPTTFDTFSVDVPFGTDNSGFYYEIVFTADTTNWIIYTGGPGTGAKMELDYAFKSGDILKVDTRNGQRSIKRVRAGASANLVGYLSADSIWLQLHPGTNNFWTSSTSFTWNKILFRPQYWGI